VLFADCGANLGWYSVIAAALGADVVACEPLPANAALLRSNVERNGLGGRIEVHEIALGDRAGTAVLRLSADNQGDHRIQPETKPENAPTAPTVPSTRPGVEVPITTLDAVLRGRRPDVLKLDTQGSEVAILRGGRAAWAPSPGRPDPAIVVELWPYGLRRAGAHESDLLALLGPLIATTHECFEIREWSRSLEPLSSAALAEIVAVGGFSAEMKGFTNLVLVPHRLRPALDGPDGAS
jgi:FkbM family methyltransferase